MDKLDYWSRVVVRAIDFLFLNSPLRSCFGVILGGVAYVGLQAAAQIVTGVDSLARVAALPFWYWFFPGLLVTHFRKIISLINKEAVVDESIENAMSVIEMGNFTDSEKRRRYRELVELVFKRIRFTDKTQMEIDSAQTRNSTKTTGDE
jgi:hypothetical protein